jgi:hypothetical protein
MQKFKWAILSLAVILAVFGAILTRPNAKASKNSEPFYAAESCVSANTDLSPTPPVH